MKEKHFFLNQPLKIVLVFMIGLAAVKILLSALISTNGMAISSLEKKILANQQINDQLIENIAQKSSIKEIYVKAQNSGFIANGPVVNYASDVPIALR